VRQLHLFKGKRQRGVVPPPALEVRTQIALAQTLNVSLSPGWNWTHIGHGGKRSAATAAVMKRSGVHPGWSDFILLSPHALAHFIELKRGTGSVVSDDQKAFAAYCNRHGYPHAIAFGFDDAIAVLKHWRAVRISVPA
jgi:VRR-NUC domain